MRWGAFVLGGQFAAIFEECEIALCRTCPRGMIHDGEVHPLQAQTEARGMTSTASHHHATRSAFLSANKKWEAYGPLASYRSNGQRVTRLRN